MHIGRNVGKLRGFRGIKQQDMAKRLNMTQQNYSLIENSKEIDDDLLKRIAEIIEFDVEDIKQLQENGTQSIFNSGSISDSIFYQNNPLEKIIELYERIIKEKDEQIENLKNLLK
jgi:Helix-turn-helix.